MTMAKMTQNREKNTYPILGKLRSLVPHFLQQQHIHLQQLLEAQQTAEPAQHNTAVHIIFFL